MEQEQVESDKSLLENFKEYSFARICSVLNNLREQGKFCDIILKIGEEEYPAHKIVLVAFSPYFESMFSGDFAEASQSCVTLTSVDANIMGDILNFAYKTKVEITENNAQAILHAANFFQATQLFKICCDYLENNINVETWIGMWRLAEVYSCSGLEEKAVKFALKHFTEVSKECEFLELEVEKLLRILSNDALDVKSEEVVFDAVIKWFYFKEDERTRVLDQVLRQVRLAHLDVCFLDDRVQAIEAIQSSPSCMKLIEEALRFVSLPSRRFELQSSISRRRNNSPQVEAMRVNVQRKGSHAMKRKFLTEDGRIVEELPWPTGDFKSVCSINSCNYKLCAYSGIYNSMYFYDESSTKWLQVVTSPLKNRKQTAVAELDGCWYFVGGFCAADGNARADVDRYDSKTAVWTPVSPLPEAVYDSSVVSLGGMLYVVGGYTGVRPWGRKKSKPTDKVQRYDPRSNNWTQSTPLPVEVTDPEACALNRRICVCSVSLGKKAYVYDLKTSEWGRCAEMPHPFQSGPVLMNGGIFVTGLRADGDVVIQRYSPSADSWQLFAIPLPDYTISSIKGPFLFKRDRLRKTYCDIVRLL